LFPSQHKGAVDQQEQEARRSEQHSGVVGGGVHLPEFFFHWKARNTYLASRCIFFSTLKEAEFLFQRKVHNFCPLEAAGFLLDLKARNSYFN
jgi:hypothetical protein